MDKEYIAKLRKQYLDSPPPGMTKKLVQGMSENDLLDMHHHLSEFEDEDDIAFGPDFLLDELCPECQAKLLKKFKN